jgi:hypothetical protein
MTNALSKNIDRHNSRYLVFTSAGDSSNLHHWRKGRRNFDLWVNYYGDEEDRYKDQCEFYIARKGGKFPNLSYVHRRWKNILDQYDAIFVVDDDIIMDGSSISRLFEIREKHDLWLLQPAFDPRGKISHSITRAKPFSFLRYANFVEVACPLFRKDKLDAFLEVYDPLLVGWGIDWWYMDLLNADSQRKVAIIDAVTCINPHDKAKGRQREIDRLQDTPTRIMNWERIKKERNIKVRRPVVLGSVKSPLNLSGVVNGLTTWIIQVVCTWTDVFKHLTWRFARRLLRFAPR